MTWATARAQIVSMIEGITIATAGRPESYGSQWREDKALTGEHRGGNRRFALRAVRHGTTPRGMMPTSRQTATEVELLVDYLIQTDGAQLDEVIGHDYEAIRERLLTSSTWGRPTSTIELVGALAEFITCDIDEAIFDDDVVARRVVIRFLCVHVAG